jgi:hypothetical protein
MTIIPNNPANDRASNASKKRNAELKSSFFRKADTVAIKKTRLRRAAHAINITSMFGIVIPLIDSMSELEHYKFLLHIFLEFTRNMLKMDNFRIYLYHRCRGGSFLKTKQGGKVMAKSRQGDLLSCSACGLVVTVDEVCGCVETVLVCCDQPMEKGKLAAAKARKKAAVKAIPGSTVKAAKASGTAAAASAKAKIAPPKAAAKAPAKPAAKPVAKPVAKPAAKKAPKVPKK